MPTRVSRKLLSCLFCLAVLTAASVGQYRSAPKKTNPRAVAVLQILPNGKAKLLPVSIFLNGQFYDARYYMAKPVPLALYDETVYEAQTDGLPSGEFTVHTARIQPNVIWGEGNWNPGAKSSSGSSKSGTITPDNSKGTSTVIFAGTVKETKEERRQDKQNEKNKKKTKDEPQPQSTTPPPTNPPKDDDDPDRPVFKRGAAEPQVKLNPADITPKQPKDDSDRPLLSKTRPVQDDKPEQITAPTSGVAGAKYVVAVSDPDPMENRPYQYHWTEAEKAKYTQQLSKMAMDAVRKFVSSGQTKAPLPKDAKFAETQLRALDLDFSNSPYMVFTGRIDPTMPSATAKAPQGAPEQLATFYVTLVIRLGTNGEMSRLLTQVTDSKHLDAAARYDLVDAVDADGDNRAELLFRRTNDAGSTFVLYRVTPFELKQVFEGGSAL
jgi:hypothetical protein